MRAIRRGTRIRAASIAALVAPLSLASAARAWDSIIVEGPEIAATTPLLPASILENRDAARDEPASLAWKNAVERIRAGQYAEALPHLDVVARAYPEIADRVALARGDARLGLEDGKAACSEYESAIKSTIDSTVEVRARVGAVRCLMQQASPKASAALDALHRRYPALPNKPQLDLELAQMYERTGQATAAVAIYRRLELSEPGTFAGEWSRTHLDELREGGARIAPLSLAQQITRTERLVSSGPMGFAKDEVSRLLAEKLSSTERVEVLHLAARIARVEGRWDEVRAILDETKGSGSASDRDREAAEASRAREADWAKHLIATQKGSKPWEKLPAFRLQSVIEIASRANLKDETNAAVAALLESKKVHPDVLFGAAIVATGVADDAVLERLFGRAAESPKWAVPARYHQARALERLGRVAEATILFEHVKAFDRSENHYYGMWAEQRLAPMRDRIARECMPDAIQSNTQARPAFLAALEGSPIPYAQTVEPRYEGMTTRLDPAVEPPRVDTATLAEAVGAVAADVGDAYPWFKRAEAMLRLNDPDAASDEILEGYLAWRDATGRPVRRVGLEAVYRGKERARRFVPFPTKRARRALSYENRQSLANVAATLGDEGTAAGLGGWDRVEARPRAYAPMVQRVAARHGLDPNLLFAVMRVESVYQRRILSGAGAIGLMQIMPRTGRLIAQKLGRDHFTPADLLDPETNLDFAAWYLASLIRRFDGHLPLAIASYNGGPHNVRRWIQVHGENMPLDAFLEEIPFNETHRYVRRVLTHYAAYRAQDGTPMESLSLALPDPKPDPVAF
ncbi:MAG: transglycosylase SLT domain-containing protein [Polyangiales bacterium]